MKKINLVVGMLAVLFVQNVSAQTADNNDTNEASHILDVNVPEVALIDIYDGNELDEAANILFDMTDVTKVSVNAEAGLYAFEDMSYENLYINYTSVVGAASGGFDASRQINVQFEAGSTFPANLDLRIKPESHVIVADGGTVDSKGAAVSSGVALGATTAIGTDALLVDSIESVYTGDGAFGVKLKYSLEQNGNFAAYQAGTYQATLLYTLTDF